jgi:propionyl-CoA carboxylase beta chain
VAPADDPPARPVPELEALIPADPRRAYDMRAVVAALVDRDGAVELGADHAPNLLTYLARLGGRAVALLASQPLHAAGALDAAAARKAARHLRLAGTWRLPVVTVVDVPGFQPGRDAEQAGILPAGADLIEAYARAPQPHLALIVRKCYGGGNVLAASAAYRLALPGGRVAPMGLRAAMEVELGPALDDASPDARRARAEAEAAWLDRNDTVWSAAESGYVDRVVAPAAAREALVRALRAQLEPRAAR